MKNVGIILREWDYREKTGESIYGIRSRLIEFLTRYDIDIICIPTDFYKKKEFDKIKRILDDCDGIILPGGNHFRKIEYDIVKYLYDKNKPTLGICLGMQVMCGTFNNRNRDIDKAKSNNHMILEQYAHKVKINKNSKLYEILEKEEILTNSRHKNRIIETNLKCVAYSEDNVLEAVEDRNKRFFIGVEWHPEALEDVNSNKLFEYFIDSL